MRTRADDGARPDRTPPTGHGVAADERRGDRVVRVGADSSSEPFALSAPMQGTGGPLQEQETAKRTRQVTSATWQCRGARARPGLAEQIDLPPEARTRAAGARRTTATTKKT